jgi:NTE family protein
MGLKRIGLALGSGAVRGYAAIPIIKKLEKEGIEITEISGSSVGALIGAYYALHGEIDSLFELSKKMEKKDYLKLVDPNNPKLSLIKGKKIKKFLYESLFGDQTFKDARIPLIICVVDVGKKKPVYISKGKLLDALMASISIPGIFPAYKIRNRMYIDGGVLDPVPIKPLLDRGLKKVVGVNLSGYRPGDKKPEDNLFPLLLHTIYMMMEQLAKRETDHRLFMLNPRFEPDPARMLNLYDWKANYEIGKEIINRKIKALKTWLDSPG